MPSGDRNLSGYEIGMESGCQYSITLPAFATTLTDTNLPRGLLTDADDTISILYKNGTSDTLTLAAGIIHPILAYTQVISSGLALTANIHVIY